MGFRNFHSKYIEKKIKSIHKDIIRLKQENRNIGDKVRSLFCHVSDNDCKAFTCTNVRLYLF